MLWVVFPDDVPSRASSNTHGVNRVKMRIALRGECRDVDERVRLLHSIIAMTRRFACLLVYFLLDIGCRGQVSPLTCRRGLLGAIDLVAAWRFDLCCAPREKVPMECL
ncbi:hypothetical protein MRX96_038489 [Rhipicephalus microplus]